MSCSGRSSRGASTVVGVIQQLLLLLLLLGAASTDAQCVGSVSQRLKMSALLDSIYPPWTDGSCLLREPAAEPTKIDDRLPVDWDSLIVQANETISALPPPSNLTDMADYLLELGADGDSLDTAPTGSDELSATETGYITSLNKKVFSINVPFDPAYSDRVSAECKRQSALFFRAYAASELWALRMHDASAKVGHGILNGNINQYGDFDQCLSIQQTLGSIGDSSAQAAPLRGRYCMAEVQPTIKPNTRVLKHLFELVQAHGMLKSNLDDPGHRVPRFSTVHWALCVPAGCTAADVQQSLGAFLHHYIADTGLQTEVKVHPALCQTKHYIWHEYFTDRTLLVWCAFALYALLVLSSTLYDLKFQTKAEWFTVFSLIKNTRSILSFKEERNDIACLHGIRFLNAMLLLIAHKSMALFFNPYINRTEMSEVLGQPWTVIGRAAAIFTDPFIMFSGFLTTFSFIERLQKGQRVRLHQEYIGRLLRIAPPLGALILICTFVLPFLGTGPLWNLVVTNHGDICKQYWWRNMLFIHNYFGFKNMCLTHTHHVGIDTELFFVAPLFIYCVWKWPRRGLMGLAAIALLTTVHRFYVTYSMRLANYVYFGTSVKQLFETADYMYILPYYRVTVYLMGVMLGYVCSKYKTMQLTEKQMKIGWYISTLSIAVAFFGPAPMGSMHYVYNPLHAASYAAFSPIAWCLFFAWTVFTAHLGYRNWVIDFFSWRGFRITTRISYAIYLTQFPIFFYNVGRTRSPQYFEFWPAVIFNTNEYLVVFLSSFLLTVLFETPFINVKKLLFSNNRHAKQAAGGGDGSTSATEPLAAHPAKLDAAPGSSAGGVCPGMMDENENSRSNGYFECDKSKLNC
uniref:NRF domain-containing protein n=4 Tax=gambiae species complex TaxID=44542 RepID=A0A1S4G9H5_ANOGA|nr:nose resistant to fluoxetine protein 6 isoform X3 [Anopheles coluzzii]XP_049463331.1 nose resistant to fluoxetine protein 6 isoform X4 [Anopheles coluzzii]XP_049463336.1 nose resistant to fluoxetine protein 6 isoform X6 [Anopheles coluzzii]XP_049463339.1 nose resistant to fluoxetine protein 6 isoform X7 [Anopheles coluzzii]